MESRDVRRAAVKAARDLIQQRASYIGALAVAATERDTAANAVHQARAAADELIADVKRRAADIIAAAERNAAAASSTYDSARTNALEAGWQTTELEQLGYPANDTHTRRNRTTTPKPATQHAEPAAEHVA